MPTNTVIPAPPPWLSRLALLGVFIACVVMPQPVSAEIYKCIDAGGHVSYSKRACPPGESLAGTFADAPAPRRSRQARVPAARAGSSSPPGGYSTGNPYPEAPWDDDRDFNAPR